MTLAGLARAGPEKSLEHLSDIRLGDWGTANDIGPMGWGRAPAQSPSQAALLIHRGGQYLTCFPAVEILAPDPVCAIRELLVLLGKLSP